MKLDPAIVRRTWIFLGTIAAIEAAVIVFQLRTVELALTLRLGSVSPIAWILALAVAAAYILYAIRALNLRPYLWDFSSFRALGPIIAVPSAILEEAVFRMTVMNLLAHAHQGPVVQVLGSALSFGAVHAVWALKGGLRAMIGAVVATSVLGAMLAIVFLASGRALLPCVVAHFLINIVLEPWMAYAFGVRATRKASVLNPG